MIVAQDTVINVPPGILWVDSPLIYEGNGSHDNFVIKGSGIASRIVLKGSATISIRNMHRWNILDVQIIKASGSPAIDHMLTIDNAHWGTIDRVFIDGFGLAAGIALTGASGGNWLNNLKILDVAGRRADTRGIGVYFDNTMGGLDNKLTNAIIHPFANALGASMVAVVGKTAGYFITNIDSNPSVGCWALDIDGAGGVHRESQIVNFGTALASGDRGAMRIVKGENIVVTNLIVEGNGAVISDHLVHLFDCWACSFSGTRFNNIHAPGFDFFHPNVDGSVQFINNTATRCTMREFIYRSGMDEVANRILP